VKFIIYAQVENTPAGVSAGVLGNMSETYLCCVPQQGGNNTTVFVDIRCDHPTASALSHKAQDTIMILSTLYRSLVQIHNGDYDCDCLIRLVGNLVCLRGLMFGGWSKYTMFK